MAMELKHLNLLKFPNGTYGFVMAKSPMEAYENFVKENSKEAK